MRINTRPRWIAASVGAIAVCVAAAPIASASSHPASTSAAPSSARCDLPRAHTYVLPSGMHALTASASALRASGLPTRPTGGDPGALKLWKLEMSRLRRLTVSRPVCGTTKRALDTIYNGTWAGNAVPRSATTLSEINGAESVWVQPKVGNNSSYTNYNTAPDASMWTGIGTYNGGSLIQAGCDSISVSIAVYKCWYEDYPETVVWDGPSIKPGQQMSVSVEYLLNGVSQVYFENMTTGDAQTILFNTPNLNRGAADFILERPNGQYLPNFGTVSTDDNYYTGDGTTYYGLVAGKNDIFRMTSNCASSGTVLSNPGEVNGTLNSFTQNTYASSPYCNTGAYNG
jgi:hypothetical protein